jgi:hypothetical protein
MGTTAGSYNLHTTGVVTSTTAAVSGIPTYGVTIYATLWSEINGVWTSVPYTYKEAETP